MQQTSQQSATLIQPQNRNKPVTNVIQPLTPPHAHHVSRFQPIIADHQPRKRTRSEENLVVNPPPRERPSRFQPAVPTVERAVPSGTVAPQIRPVTSPARGPEPVRAVVSQPTVVDAFVCEKPVKISISRCNEVINRLRNECDINLTQNMLVIEFLEDKRKGRFGSPASDGHASLRSAGQALCSQLTDLLQHVGVPPAMPKVLFGECASLLPSRLT